MAKQKKKKYPKLPNGFGSVKRLSGDNRTNPYGVYPPATEIIEIKNNKAVMAPTAALTYVDSWIAGVAVLNAYHSGAYTPGQELPDYLEGKKESDILQGILRDFNTGKRIQSGAAPSKTFADVYELYFNWKFVDDGTKEYSAQTLRSARAAYGHFKALHDHPFCDLVHDDFQALIDGSGLGYSSRNNMISLVRGMSRYSKIYKIIQEDESTYLSPKIESTSEQGDPFDDTELSVLWKNSDDPTIEMILIMSYSGYRISAYKTISIDFQDNYFQGGIKNKSSKNRIVPIHSSIQDLVRRRMDRDGELMGIVEHFRADMKRVLNQLGIRVRTPHDCRHTFSRLCEHYKVSENDRKRLLGHSFGNDITNKVYGHRTLEELRLEIEKIKACQ